MIRLIAIDDVKTLLPIRSGNSSYDARLKDITATVTRMIEKECRTTFAREERTESHTARATATRTLNLYGDGSAYNSGADEQIIPLRAAPIVETEDAPITVWYDPLRRFDDDTIIPPEYWTLDADRSRILFTFPTHYTRSGIRVRYTAGYDVGEDGTLSEALAEHAPDLREAAMLGCLHMWNRSQPQVAGTNKGDEQETGHPNSYGLPKETLALIAPYRRVLTGRG